MQKNPTLTNDKILNAYKSQMLMLWFCSAIVFFLVYHCIKSTGKCLHRVKDRIYLKQLFFF